MPTEWFVVTKTGQVVASFMFTAEGKPDLSVYYEHPELYDTVLDPDPKRVKEYRETWMRFPRDLDEISERRTS